MSISQIVVSDPLIQVIPVEENVVVTLGFSGPQGAPGNTQVVAFVFVQNTPSSIWTITHGLDFVPNITVVDTAGSVVEGDYSYPDENTIIATFSGGFAGKAYLS